VSRCMCDAHGIATVELTGSIEDLTHMLPDSADRLADALRLAAEWLEASRYQPRSTGFSLDARS
jgi:hypothetical protein